MKQLHQTTNAKQMHARVLLVFRFVISLHRMYLKIVQIQCCGQFFFLRRMRRSPITALQILNKFFRMPKFNFFFPRNNFLSPSNERVPWIKAIFHSWSTLKWLYIICIFVAIYPSNKNPRIVLLFLSCLRHLTAQPFIIITWKRINYMHQKSFHKR